MAWMIPAAIFSSALFGSKAASSAASTQANAASQSADVSKQISDQQIALAREQYNAQLLAQEPFRQGGLAAQNKLMRLLGVAMPPNYNAMGGTSLVTEQGVTAPTAPLPQTDSYVPGTVYAPGKTFADGSYVNNAGHLLVPDKVDPTMYVDKGLANVAKPATTPVTPVTPVKPVTTPVTPVTPVKPVTPTTTPTSTTPTSTTPTTPTSTTPTTAPLDAATVASYQAAVQGMTVAQIAAQAQKLGLSAAQVGQVIGVSAAEITAAGYSPTGGTIDPNVANNTFTSPGQFAQVAPTATPAAAAPPPGTQFSDGSYVNNAGHLLVPSSSDPNDIYIDKGLATAQSTANLQAPPAAQPDMGGDMMGVQSFNEGSPGDFQPQPMMMSRSMAPMAMSMSMDQPQALNAAAPTTDVFGDMTKIMQMTGSPQEIDAKLAQYMDSKGVSPKQVQAAFNSNGNNVTEAQIQEHYVNANPQGVYSDFGSAAKPFSMNMPSTVNSSGQTVPGGQFDPSSLLSNFSPADFTAQTDPGYAFRFKEGERAVNNSMAARGLGISGAGLKAATKYGQDMGSQEYQNAYNRFQTNRANQGQVYGNAFNQAQVERTNLLNPLQSLMGSGQTSANQVNNLSGNFTNQVNSSLGNYGTNATNALVGGANARASGYVGGANALSSALSTGLNYANNNAMLEAYKNKPLYPYSVPTANTNPAQI